MSLVTQITAAFTAVGNDVQAYLARLVTAENKLSGIETGATADQTAAQIKTAYESNLDTNAFTDVLSGKLAVIEANATADQTGAEIKTAYEANANTNAFTDAQASKVNFLTVTAATDVDAIRVAVEGIGSAVVLKGEWSAAGTTFPVGTKAGWSYIVSVAGTVGGIAFAVGDRIIATKANASSTIYAANWFKADGSDEVQSVNGRIGAVAGLQEASAIGDTASNFTLTYTTARDT